MGEKGQAMMHNMDLLGDIGHGAQSVGDFVSGGANAVPQFIQGAINGLATNNDPNTQAEIDAIAAAQAGRHPASQAISAQASGTPASQPASGGEKGNLQQIGSASFPGQEARGIPTSGAGPVATTGLQGSGVSPTERGGSPTAGPTINPNPIK